METIERKNTEQVAGPDKGHIRCLMSVPADLEKLIQELEAQEN